MNIKKDLFEKIKIEINKKYDNKKFEVYQKKNEIRLQLALNLNLKKVFKGLSRQCAIQCMGDFISNAHIDYRRSLRKLSSLGYELKYARKDLAKEKVLRDLVNLVGKS